MFHHDSRDYDVAASEAAQFARDKFEKMVTSGAERMRGLVERMDELVPDDQVVPARTMKFWPRPRDDHRALTLSLDKDDVAYTLHRHALGQIGQRSGIKAITPVLRDLTVPDAPLWKRQLAAHTLNEAYSNNQRGRFLVRSIVGDVRGFLSDKYRRYDVRPIAGAFLEAIQSFGCSALDGIATETKVSFRVVLPHLFEPVENEVMLYGLEFKNSDFGDGKLVVRSFVDRVWCTNLATLSSEIDQVHLGARLPDSIELSQRTYELDTQTMASAVGDVVKTILAPEAANQTMRQIAAAHADARDYSDFNSALKNLTKGERDQVGT